MWFAHVAGQIFVGNVIYSLLISMILWSILVSISDQGVLRELFSRCAFTAETKLPPEIPHGNFLSVNFFDFVNIYIMYTNMPFIAHE
jgi:hypothetical protein